MSNGDISSLFATTGTNALKLSIKVRTFNLNGRVSANNKGCLQQFVTLSGFARSSLSSTFIITGTKTCPRSKVRVRRKSGHINTGYSKNSFCTIWPNACNRIDCIHRLTILLMHITVNLIIERCNVLIQFVNVQKDNTQHLLLKRR